MRTVDGYRWLTPVIGATRSFSERVILGTMGIEALVSAVDGRQWLSAAPFSRIDFGIDFGTGGGAAPTSTVRGDVLEISTSVDLETLPDGDLRWYFFHFVLNTLNEIAGRHGLSVPPPLDVMPRPPDDLPGTDHVPVMTAMDAGAELMGIQAELAGLQDGEILVIALNRAGDDEVAAEARIRKIDARLERKLGPIGGSSSLGNGYMWAVAIRL
jgi:hypothetical protein